MPGIDSFILDLTERLCQRIQRFTGRTNVWLAVQLTNLSIVVFFLWAAISFQRVHIALRIGVAAFCAVLLYALSQTVFKDSIEQAEQFAYRRVAKGFRNPRRLRDVPLRISFLTLSALVPYPLLFVDSLRVTFAFLTYALVLLTTVLLYVLSCDPLPPCVGKVREWLNGLAASRSELVRQEARAPGRR